MLIQNFEARGTCEHRRATDSSPFGSPIIIRTPKNVTKVLESFSQSLSRSMSSTERQTSGAYNLGNLLIFLVHV